jgi:tetratricopeptide (TPR) repeat protein
VAAEIKRDEAGRLIKKLQECRLHLQKDNVYSCIIGFRDVLEKFGKIRMLPADEKQLNRDINVFQADLAASRAFRHLYGPVTFKDDDVATALDFMEQLIQIKEEEIAAVMASQQQGTVEGQDDLQGRINEIIMLVEKGEFATAKEQAEKDEEAADALMEMYNTSGIECRKEKDFDKAITIFKKALFVRPEDEGLYYNMSRAYIEAGDWKSAKNTMVEALEKCPEFKEGIDLLAFINENIR